MIIRGRNFTVYEDTGNVEIKPGLSLIMGKFVNDEAKSNGSGKSSFIELLPWVWWGVARTTKESPAGDELIRRPPDGRTMMVDIDYDGFSVSRQRKYNKTSKLEMFFEGDRDSGNKAEVQGKITNVLGMTYDLFKHTFYIPVHGAGLFTNLGPTEAKEKIIEMLALSKWNERKKKINNDVNELKKKINDAEVSLSAYSSVGDEDVDKLNEELERIDVLNKQTKDDYNYYVDERDKVTQELEGINNEINQINMSLLEQRHKRDIKTTCLNRLETINNDINRHGNERNKIQGEIDESINKINNLKIDRSKKLAEYNGLLRIQEEFDKELINIAKNKSGMDQFYSQLEEEISINNHEYNKNINILVKLRDGGTIQCPVTSNECPVLNDDSYKDKQIASYNLISGHIQETLARLVKEQVATEEEYEAINSRVKIIEEHRITINNMEKVLDNINTNISVNEFEIKSLQSNYDHITNSIISNTNDKELVEAQLKDCEEVIVDSSLELKLKMNNLGKNELITTIDTNKENIRRLGEEIANYDYQKAIIQTKLDKISQVEDKMKEIKNKLEEDKLEFDDLSILANAFSMDGIPTYIINSASSEIETIANNILELVDHPARISIELKEQTKVKDPITKQFKLQDTFKISVSDSITGEVFNYGSTSNGESFWIDFSIRVALGVCAKSRNDILPNLFIIDEGLGALDSVAQQKFMMVLRTIMNKYDIKYIWLITHAALSYARDYVDSIITCWRDADEGKAWITVE
jgi:DNA repair exonuclease SbcCD ATPase subunit